MRKRRQIMTGVLAVALVVILAGIVLGSRSQSLDQEELRAKAGEALGGDVQFLSKAEQGEKALFWFYAHTEEGRAYLCLDCQQREDGYQILRTLRPQVDTQGVVHCKWGDDYAFVMDNPDCKTFRLTDGSEIVYEADLSQTEEGDFPYPLLVEDLPRRFAYIALDQNGEALPD